MTRGDMDGAMKMLDLGIEMNPDDVATHLMRGQVQAVQGDREGALASAEKVLELDPGNEKAGKIIEQLDQ
jgi:lipopolysaccharide biosynthesis regulator YciM